MPIYEFVCESCGRLTEVMQKVSDPPPGACTECGGRVARMVSRTSFQLKGGGWYADLYSSAKEKPAAADKPPVPGAAAATPASPAAKADSSAPASPAPAPKAAPAPSAPSGGAAGSSSSSSGGASGA